MANVVVRPSGAPNNAASAPSVSIASGAVVTLVVASTSAPTVTSPAAQLVECVDNSGTLGFAGVCTVVSM